MTEQAELVLDARAELGEGSIWDYRNGLLYWIDILKREVHLFDPVTKSDECQDVGQLVGTVVPKTDGRLMLALERGFCEYDPESRTLGETKTPEDHPEGVRFNDGKCDPAGSFWAGTMNYSGGEAARGALYRLDVDGGIHTMLTGVGVSNGIVWNEKLGKMYYIDTPTREVAEFDYDAESGGIRNRRVAVTFPEDEGFPDGMTIDAEGMLWVAHWGGGAVSRWDPTTGEKVASIKVPADFVTSCALGGSALDELYITTARTGMDETALSRQPLAGGLFCARVETQGVPAYLYRGVEA